LKSKTVITLRIIAYQYQYVACQYTRCFSVTSRNPRVKRDLNNIMYVCYRSVWTGRGKGIQEVNNESSEVCGIIKPGRRVKLKSSQAVNVHKLLKIRYLHSGISIKGFIQTSGLRELNHPTLFGYLAKINYNR